MMNFDGKKLAEEFRDQLKNRILNFQENKNRKPCLAVLKATDDPGAESYLKRKKKVFSECGADLIAVELEKTVTLDEYIYSLRKLNGDKSVDGIILEMPLPKSVSYENALLNLSIEKDVEGITSENIAKIFRGKDAIIPSTPQAVIKILESENITTSGKRVIIIGRSEIVTKPLALLLLKKGDYGDATITICHSKTQNLACIVKEGEIIISAAGIPGLITRDMISDNAVVIDVGTGSVPDISKKCGYRIAGDVNFEECKSKCSFITPVPGGVGPVTGVMLLENLMILAEKKKEK